MLFEKLVIIGVVFLLCGCGYKRDVFFDNFKLEKRHLNYDEFKSPSRPMGIITMSSKIFEGKWGHAGFEGWKNSGCTIQLDELSGLNLNPRVTSPSGSNYVGYVYIEGDIIEINIQKVVTRKSKDSSVYRPVALKNFPLNGKYKMGIEIQKIDWAALEKKSALIKESD